MPDRVQRYSQAYVGFERFKHSQLIIQITENHRAG